MLRLKYELRVHIQHDGSIIDLRSEKLLSEANHNINELDEIIDKLAQFGKLVTLIKSQICQGD